MKKDATDRALRLTKRNALISNIFYELTNNEGFGFMQAYVFLEEISIRTPVSVRYRIISRVLKQQFSCLKVYESATYVIVPQWRNAYLT